MQLLPSAGWEVSGSASSTSTTPMHSNIQTVALQRMPHAVGLIERHATLQVPHAYTHAQCHRAPMPRTNRDARNMARKAESLPAQEVSRMPPSSMTDEARRLPHLRPITSVGAGQFYQIQQNSHAGVEARRHAISQAY